MTAWRFSSFQRCWTRLAPRWRSMMYARCNQCWAIFFWQDIVDVDEIFSRDVFNAEIRCEDHARTFKKFCLLIAEVNERVRVSQLGFSLRRIVAELLHGILVEIKVQESNSMIELGRFHSTEDIFNRFKVERRRRRRTVNQVETESRSCRRRMSDRLCENSPTIVSSCHSLEI